MGAAEVAKPVVAMILVQVSFAGINIFYKLAVCDGMDMRILVAYRYLFASVVLAPIAYYVERKRRTKLTWSVVLLSFMCGLSGGSLAQNLYISGLKLTSATFATAITNLIPAITFVLAVIFRYEKLSFRTAAGQVKIAGTLLGVGGAMLLTFYKGVDITPWNSHVDFAAALTARHHGGASSTSSLVEASSNRVMGALLVTASCFFYALWLNLQARLAWEYAFPYSTTALMCIMSATQSVAYAICYDRDWAQWRLAFGVRLLAVVYSGMFASGVMLVVLAWCIERRGPLFASVFNPLMLLVVAVLSSLLLGERLHLGSALGAVLVVTGLYAVLWGKGREPPTDGDKIGVGTSVDGQVQIVVQSSPPAEEDDKIRPGPAAAN